MNDLRGHRNILLDCESVEDLRCLERASDAEIDETRRAAVRDVARFEPDASAGQRNVSGNDIEHSALAGAVWTDKSPDGAALDGKAEISHGRQPAEEVRHVFKR